MDEDAARAIEPAITAGIASTTGVSDDAVVITGYTANRRLDDRALLRRLEGGGVRVDFEISISAERGDSVTTTLTQVAEDAAPLLATVQEEIVSQGMETVLEDLGLESGALAVQVDPPVVALLPLTTVVEREGDVVTLDWAKCCDCEDDLVKPAGMPCKVTLLAGETLRLRYESSAYAHNVFELPNKDAFDQCLMDSASEVAGGEEGVTSLDIALDFPTAGTFFYVCARHCDPVKDWCHCRAFTHKLQVRVLPNFLAPTPIPTPSTEELFEAVPPASPLSVALTFRFGPDKNQEAAEAAAEGAVEALHGDFRVLDASQGPDGGGFSVVLSADGDEAIASAAASNFTAMASSSGALGDVGAVTRAELMARGGGEREERGGVEIVDDQISARSTFCLLKWRCP